MKGFIEFEFDLPEGLLTNLVRVFDSMDTAVLTQENVAQIADAQGVYQLRLDGQLVYIGKTDAAAGLRKRLERHARTIQHRLNLDATRVTFKAVRVFVFTAIDLETQLIRHYGKIASVAWNFSGFGSNDPGRERDTTNVKPDGFDDQFPIDIDRSLDQFLPSPAKAAAVLAQLRNHLPYILRFEPARPRTRQPHPELAETDVSLPQPPHTARAIIKTVIATLPAGWQATAFPGRIIIYRENRDYPFGTVIARSSLNSPS